jgi:hypothetical protein
MPRHLRIQFPGAMNRFIHDDPGLLHLANSKSANERLHGILSDAMPPEPAQCSLEL